MGGEIGVYSDLGEGSTFWFAAPFQKVEIAAAETPMFPPLNGPRLLVVEDLESSRRVITSYLSLWNAGVEFTANLSEAAKMCRGAAKDGHAFDALIVSLPGAAAAVTPILESLKQSTDLSALPRILLTGPAWRLAALQNGHKDHACLVAKPVRRNHLYDALVQALPRMSAASSGALPIRPVGTHRAAEVARGRILVAEDNIVNQKVAVRTLEKLGFQIDVATNGLEALEALERKTFDLVLMDCQMPKMDGFEATRAIRQIEAQVRTGQLKPSPRSSYGRKHFRTNGIPIVALTANAMKGDREICLESGMDDYLSKPIQSQRVIEMMDYFFPSSKAAVTTVAPAANPEVCDVTALLARFEDDTALIQELALLFLDDAPSLVEKIRQAVQSCDSSSLEKAAHALKGSVSNFCAQQAQEAAVRLEEIGRAGEAESAEPALRCLEKSLNELQPLIERLAGR